MPPQQRKVYQVKQDDEDRKNYDAAWDKINAKLSSANDGYEAPDYPFQAGALIRDYNSLYLKIYDKEKYVNM